MKNNLVCQHCGSEDTILNTTKSGFACAPCIENLSIKRAEISLLLAYAKNKKERNNLIDQYNSYIFNEEFKI